MPERKRRENQPVDTLTAERPIGTRHIQILLDRSGSMESIKDAMTESLQAFLREQQAIPGADEVRFTLTQFDNTSIEDTTTGTLLTAMFLGLQPRGNTPLYDALGKTIREAEKRMGPDDVMLFVTITDGQENASITWTRDSVQKLIAEKMDSGWTFLYLGANQDAWGVGASLGYQRGTTMNYDANAVGVRAMSSSVNATVTGYRMSETRAELKNLKIEDPTSKAWDKAKAESVKPKGRKRIK